jgi:hypothetical protein
VALRVLSNCAVAKAKKEFSDPAANGTKANFLQTTSLLSRSTKIYFKKAYENSPSLGSCFTEASHVVRVPELADIISTLPTAAGRDAWEEVFHFVTDTSVDVCLKTSPHYQEVRF